MSSSFAYGLAHRHYKMRSTIAALFSPDELWRPFHYFITTNANEAQVEISRTLGESVGPGFLNRCVVCSQEPDGWQLSPAVARGDDPCGRCAGEQRYEFPPSMLNRISVHACDSGNDICRLLRNRHRSASNDWQSHIGLSSCSYPIVPGIGTFLGGVLDIWRTGRDRRFCALSRPNKMMASMSARAAVAARGHPVRTDDETRPMGLVCRCAPSV